MWKRRTELRRLMVDDAKGVHSTDTYRKNKKSYKCIRKKATTY